MLTGFDVGVGILVLISAILATARGLTREVLSLATWAGSAAIAIYMYLYHPDLAQRFIKDETVANIATVVVSFLLALIVLQLITMRIADFVVDSRIGPLDRTLGFVFGVARGVLIAVVLVIFTTWLVPDLENQPYVTGSKTIPPLRNIGAQLMTWLPDDLERQITAAMQGQNDRNAAPQEPPTTATSPDASGATPPPADSDTSAPLEPPTPADTSP